MPIKVRQSQVLDGSFNVAKALPQLSGFHVPAVFVGPQVERLRHAFSSTGQVAGTLKEFCP